jgi:hypothetical protein
MEQRRKTLAKGTAEPATQLGSTCCCSGSAPGAGEQRIPACGKEGQSSQEGDRARTNEGINRSGRLMHYFRVGGSRIANQPSSSAKRRLSLQRTLSRVTPRPQRSVPDLRPRHNHQAWGLGGDAPPLHESTNGEGTPSSQGARERGHRPYASLPVTTHYRFPASLGRSRRTYVSLPVTTHSRFFASRLYLRLLLQHQSDNSHHPDRAGLQ